MMIPQVSIIVPVYNVENYLRKCLDSLVNQTLENIQIIVVNDGTKDNSQTIIDEYVAKFPERVFSYVKDNGGLGDARNFGLKHASATYIGFIDSDDYVKHDMYEKLHKKAIDEHADLVLCDIEYVWEDNHQTLCVSGFKNVAGGDVRRAAFLSPLFAWNKLYHRDLFFLNNIRYPNQLWYEDIPVSIPFIALAQKIAYVNEVLVYYVQRGTSIMASKNTEKMRDIFQVLMLSYDFYVKNDLLAKYRNEIEYLFIEQLMLYGSFRFYRSHSSFALMSEAFVLMKSVFPEWKKNKYIKTLHPLYRIYLKFANHFTLPLYKVLILIKDFKT